MYIRHVDTKVWRGSFRLGGVGVGLKNIYFTPWSVLRNRNGRSTSWEWRWWRWRRRRPSSSAIINIIIIIVIVVVVCRSSCRLRSSTPCGVLYDLTYSYPRTDGCAITNNDYSAFFRRIRVVPIAHYCRVLLTRLSVGGAIRVRVLLPTTHHNNGRVFVIFLR